MPSSSLVLASGSGTTRKRVLEELLEEGEPPLRRARRDVLSTELETLKAELEHERTLRQLDHKKFQQTKDRLERQIEFAVEEANQAKSMMEELEQTSKEHIEQLRQARQEAQMELREVQIQLDEEIADRAHDSLAENPRIKRLEDSLAAKTKETQGLDLQVANLREELRDMAENQRKLREQVASSAISRKDDDEGGSSPAPKAVVKELNKVRIQLAETEREKRQLRRTVEGLQSKSKQLIQEREVARSATIRVQKLEQDRQETLKSLESSNAEIQSWKEFGKALGNLLVRESSTQKNLLFNNPDLPPEISAVQRYLSMATKKADEVSMENEQLKKQLDQSQEITADLETKAREFDREEASWKSERSDTEKSTKMLEQHIKVLEGQEAVYKREIESLRSIVETFDNLPLPGKSTVSVTSQPGMQLLEERLKAAENEIQLWKDGEVQMKKNLEQALMEKTVLQKTHNTVLEKFGKLRDAVFAERTKAEKAEQRAVQAEEHAGKGAFNPDTTRVLHLQHNPLVEALKNENQVLKRQVKALQHSSERKVPLPATDVDPEKLHQRLKQSFKEQIGRFREGVYILTGYKIDMIPTSDRPKFKVRSVFAEQEDDHLVFQWPQGDNVTAMDLLDTDMAKQLTTTDSFQYVQRFHSMPAFLASVQLNLFEKQTML